MFLEHEAIVLETIPITHDLHIQIPLIFPIQDRFDKMRLPVCDVKKHAVVFQDPQDLLAISIELSPIPLVPNLPH